MDGEVGAVEAATHHAQPFAVAPIEPAVLRVALDLLTGHKRARRHDDGSVASVEICAFDVSVVLPEILAVPDGAHEGVVEMPVDRVDGNAIRHRLKPLDQNLHIVAARGYGHHTGFPAKAQHDNPV